MIYYELFKISFGCGSGVSQLTAILFNKYGKQREEKRRRVYSLNAKKYSRSELKISSCLIDKKT